ncbi:MAG TPA: hypothetical protein VEH29_08420 [Acidimicrobiales bacterium]|nr:hypothetical protein [Acidimicrobiales bacterium]
MRAALSESVMRLAGDRRVGVTAEEVLQEDMDRTASMIAYCEERITQLAPEMIVNGQVSVEVREGDDPKNRYTATVTSSGVHVWVQLLLSLQKHAVDLARLAIAAGFEERKTRLQEYQALLIADAVRAIILDPDLRLDAQEQEHAFRVAARHLRALPVASED